MKHYFHEINLKSESPVEFIDITDVVKNAVAESKISKGSITVFTSHTTSAIKVNERCERLQKDMIRLLSDVVPALNYSHDEDTVDGRANARGHLMSLLLNASETIPVSDGKMLLGDWQSIFFVELDGPRSKRHVLVNVTGT